MCKIEIKSKILIKIRQNYFPAEHTAANSLNAALYGWLPRETVSCIHHTAIYILLCNQDNWLPQWHPSVISHSLPTGEDVWVSCQHGTEERMTLILSAWYSLLAIFILHPHMIKFKMPGASFRLVGSMQKKELWNKISEKFFSCRKYLVYGGNKVILKRFMRHEKQTLLHSRSRKRK